MEITVINSVDLYQTFLLSIIIGLLIYLLFKIKFQIMTTEEAIVKIEETNAKLDQTNVKLDKVTGEVVSIKLALADALANGDAVPPALEAAINASSVAADALDAKAQSIDDLTPDEEV